MTNEETQGQDPRGIVYSQKIKAGKKTYFVDVKRTLKNDHFILLTESRRTEDDNGYFKFDRSQIVIYKEDFNKVLNALSDAIETVKTEFLPDFDYNQFDREPAED